MYYLNEHMDYFMLCVLHYHSLLRLFPSLLLDVVGCGRTGYDGKTIQWKMGLHEVG